MSFDQLLNLFHSRNLVLMCWYYKTLVYFNCPPGCLLCLHKLCSSIWPRKTASSCHWVRQNVKQTQKFPNDYSWNIFYKMSAWAPIKPTIWCVFPYLQTSAIWCGNKHPQILCHWLFGFSDDEIWKTKWNNKLCLRFIWRLCVKHTWLFILIMAPDRGDTFSLHHV